MANVIGPRGAASSVTGSAGMPGQQLGAPGRLADRGRGEHEDQVRRARLAVVRGDPAEPAQHLRDVRAEDAAVAVALVHDHVPQPRRKPLQR